jgi:hypothetical protein
MSFMETIFEKQGMFEKKTLLFMLNLLKNIPKKFCGFRLHVIVPHTCSLKHISKHFPKNSKFLTEKNFSNFAQNNPAMETHYHVMETHNHSWKQFFSQKWVSING